MYNSIYMCWDLCVEQVSWKQCRIAVMHSQCSKKISKLKKKKIRQDLNKYLYQVIQPQQIFAEIIPITKLSGCKPIQIWFLTFWLHLENLMWSEYWLERQRERRNTSRMSRHKSMSGRGHTHSPRLHAAWTDDGRHVMNEHISTCSEMENCCSVTTDGPYVTVSCVIN